MHPRSIYRDSEATNFQKLAYDNPDLKRFLREDNSLDFSNPETDYVLAETLLKRDFNLNVKLSRERLCPRVSNRLEYVLWVQDLLDSTSPAEYWPDCVPVSGIDIGTGASALYALLCCKLRSNWHMIGTDIDPEALQIASENVETNFLRDRIKICKGSDKLIDLDGLQLHRVEFTMCNPPFYHSMEELDELKKRKATPPNSVLLATPAELVTQGGEGQFIKTMVDESLALRDRVRWYTSQCGKLSTVESLVKYLRAKNITNYAIAEFDNSRATRKKSFTKPCHASSGTKRWGVAWSFWPTRPWMSVCRISSPSLRSASPPPCEKSFIICATKRSDIMTTVHKFLDSLQFCDWVAVSLDAHAADRFHNQNGPQGLSAFDISAPDNVWSRSFRRKLKQANIEGKMDNLIDALGHKSAVIKMRLYIYSVSHARINVTLRWICGTDYSLFESFEGSLWRIFNSDTNGQIWRQSGSVEN